MNARLPIVSGRDAVARFKKFGYVVIRQKGSHIRLKHLKDPSRKPLTIPDHKVLGKGLLRKLLRDAHMSVEEFVTIK